MMSTSSRFARLLEPGLIGSVKTRNRIIKTGAGLLMWHRDELHMNGAVKAFYENLAKGGVGLIIVESPVIDYPTGARWPNRYRIDEDKYIPGLSELTQVIHKHNCPTFMQMNHDGPWQRALFGQTPFYTGQPIASSAVSVNSSADFHNEMPRELTVAEIENIIDKFAAAAVRAQKAGFDGVDINAGSSHLLHNFLSPYWNRRQDNYGGSPENRARIVTSIIKEIKKRLGQDFPVTVCINGIEVGMMAGIDNSQCMTPAYSRQIGRILQEAGADAIQLRNQWLGYHVGSYLPDLLHYPERPISAASFPGEYNWKQRGVGANINFAANMKKVISIPVITVGRLDPIIGEKYLREGKADFIGMTRRLQADPELPNKVAAGKLKDIAPCTACENCLGTQRCRINPLMGLECTSLGTTKTKKKVVVLGGGPAGMEAARVAAVRGHDVTLFEKANKLGGLLPVATIVKGTEQEDLPAIVKYYEGQLSRLGVKIHLGKEANASLIEQLKPDVVVLAVGGIPSMPQIPGVNSPKVIGGGVLHNRLKSLLKIFSPQTLRRLSAYYLPIGKKAVIIGGGIHGLELGEFLTKRGRKVTIVDTAETLGSGMIDVILEYLMLWFKRKGVTIISGVKEYVEINDKGLTIITKEGEKITLEADNIIPALPLQSNTELFDQLVGKVPEMYAVGDCKEPLLIADAIGTGARTLLNV